MLIAVLACGTGTVAAQQARTPLERAVEQLRKADKQRVQGEAIRVAIERARAAIAAAKQARSAAEQATAAARTASRAAKEAMDAVRAAEGAIAAKSPDTPLAVRIDPAVQFQTMQGFGSTARVFEDHHIFENHSGQTNLTGRQQDEILDMLYGTLGLTRTRLIFERYFETDNDNDDPNVADMSKFDFSRTRGDDLVRFGRRLVERGAEIVFPTSNRFEKWMTAETDPAEFAEQIILRLRRWRELGLDLKYYSIINEPGYSRGGIWSGAFIRDVIRRAGPRLRAEGFTTKFVVPDDWGVDGTYERSQVILADPGAREHVGAIGFHLYHGDRNDLARLRDLSAQYGIPLWMTEYSLYDSHIFDELYKESLWYPLRWAVLMNDLMVDFNVAAIDYMMGFFGQWGEDRWPGAQLIVLKNDGDYYRGYERTKQYYLVGQYSRFVRPGARRVKTHVDRGTVRISAFRKGKDLTLVGINAGSAPRRVAFTVEPGSDLQIGTLRAIRTGKQENWRELEKVAVEGNKFEAVLPANSVTTFTTIPAGSLATSEP